MKKFSSLLLGGAIIASSAFLSSCGDDDGILSNDPDVNFGTSGGGFTSDATIADTINSFTVNVIATKGDKNLSTFAIEVGDNDALINTSNFVVVDGTDTVDVDNNPFSLPNKYNDGFNWVITINQTPAAGSSEEYEFKVEDNDGNSGDRSITITKSASSPAVSTIPGVLMNSAGVAGTGGLDLDTGDQTGSSDAAAEIKDEGIDGSIAIGTENWKQQISGANGTTLVTASTSEYDNAATVADLQAAYEAGTSFTVSSKVAVGDIFIAKNGDKYYGLKVTAVTPVANSNADEIEFEIKK